MDLVIDIALLAIVVLVTFFVAQDGPWNAILTMFSVIFSGLLAMNFFEPLASFLAKQNDWLKDRADFLCLVGLFALFTFLMRLGLEQVAPTNLDLPDIAYRIGQWGFGFATGYITMAILLTALHTAPMPRKFLGFSPERKNFLGMTAPDVQWLGFTQHVTSSVFGRRFSMVNENGQREVGYRCFDGMRHLFPGKTESDYLPTFIMRYATWRQRTISKQGASAAPQQIIIPNKPGQAPVGPGL